MRLVTYRTDGGCRPGLLQDGAPYDLRDVAGPACPASLRELLAGGLDDLFRALARFDPARCQAVPDPRLCAPLPRPGKILAVGRNYGEHARETGYVPQAAPRILVKLASSVTGPDAVIRRPAGVEKLDWEVEIAAVIGAPLGGSRVTAAQAEAAIAGYTIANDVTAREFQLDCTPPQTSFSKSMDGFCPMGPALVTADEVGDLSDITLRAWVNGQLMQEGRVADMLVPVPELVAHVARYVALEPGDVILTGTPAGSGAFRSPPVFLEPGDRLRLEVDRLGVLENAIG